MIRKHYIRLLLLLSLTGIGLQDVSAQVMISATGKPASLVICQEDGTFTLLIANTTGSTMSGATLAVDLPSGCVYSPGSATGATDLDISNLNQPTFSLPDILNNTAHEVTYDASLICGYNNSDNFNYTVTYNSSTYTGFDTPLQNYYFPVLVISNITNAFASIPVGQTVIRDITVEQQGLNASTDTLIILDSHTADIEVISTSIGTLYPYSGPGPTIVDTIIITGSDLPGGNNLFDFGESIVISETVKLVGCENGQSTIKAAWGCNNEYCSFYAAFPSVSPLAGSTNINMNFTGNRKDWAFIDDSGWVEFTVTNNGSGYGIAFNLVVLAGFSSGGSTYYPNSNWLNEIDSFSVNGNFLLASYNYASGAINGRYSHYTTFPFTTDPDGPGVGLEDIDDDGYFDDLPVGNTITMKAHTYYDWNEAMSTIATRNNCGYGWTNNHWQAFRFGNLYQDQCSDTYGVNWISNGNLTVLQSYYTITTLHTIPPDLYNATTAWMEQTVNTNSDLSDQACPNDSVNYKVILPPGINIGSGTATFKNVSMGNPVMSGDTAIYQLDKSRVYSGGTFRVPVILDCEAHPPPPPLASISTRLQLWCDKLFHSDRYFTYWCSTSPIFGTQCPIGNCPDPSINSFNVSRTTLGWTDNFLSARVAPDTPGLRLDNAMARDTIRIEADGKLNGPVDSLYFRLQHDGMPGNWGNQLFFDVLADTLIYYDIENDRVDTCTGLSPQVTNGSTCFLSTYLGDLNQPDSCLAGIVFSGGDMITYIIYGQVRNVSRYGWETVPAFRGRFYWEDEGNEEFCNDRGVTFNVLGSNYTFYTTTFYQQILLEGCNAFQYEGLIYRTLDPCGGDANFPGEIRPYNVLDSMTFILPEGFVYQTGSSRHGYHNDYGSLVNQVIADPLIDVSASGTRLIFVRDSTWGYSDYYDCYNNRDRIRFTASPSCEALGNYAYQMYATGHYDFYADGIGIAHSGSNSKTISYTPPLIGLTPLIITAEGIEDTVTWKIRLCNQRSFEAENNWLGFENANEGITVVSVTDITDPGNPIIYQATSYGTGKTWVQTGSITGNFCRNFLVKAVYSVCDYDSLLVRHGSNCAGPPVNPDLGYPPSGYICEENTTWLYLDPKDVSVNLSITSPVNPVDLCDTLMYEAVVTNTQLSYAFDLKLIVAVPPGLTILPGVSMFKYPYTTGSYVSISDPVNEPAGSNKWVFDISNDPNGIGYLLGVDSVPKNGYRLQFKIITDCEFTSGRSLQVFASAANACGEVQTRGSYTQQLLITNIPTNVNLYVINTTSGAGFNTCSDPTPVHVKVINLGPSSVSTIEKLKISIDDAFDFVPGSMVNLHNGPSSYTNTTIAGIRYIDFDIEPNLAVNDSIVFSFQFEDIDPGSLQCDTIPLETNTLLVAMVYCQTVPGDSCLIHSITSTQIQHKPIFKDHVGFANYSATSVPDGTTGETVSISYAIQNIGTDTLNSSTLDVLFVYDANNNGIPDDTGSDSLYMQTVTTGGTLPGESVIATAIFPVPGDKVCKILAAMRLSDNGCTCGDVVLPVNNIHLLNAGPDVEVCMQVDAQLGMPGITGYSYYWIPTSFLNSHTLPDPIFNYNTLLSQADTTDYILLTTRPGNCVTRDTTEVIVLPSAIAFAGADTVACTSYPHLLADALVINSNLVLWSTSGTGTFDDTSLVNATYTPSLADWTLGTVTLSLFAVGLCGDDTDAMILTFNDPATSYAGPDTAICANWTFTVTSAIATNYSSLEWVTTGDGAFNATGILLPEYTPGPVDIASGSVELILQAFGLTSCPVEGDTLVLTLTPPPAITNSPLEKTICSGDSTNILLTTTQPGATLTWTAALTSGTITGFADGSGSLINQILVNMDTIPGSVTYSITPNTEGCIGITVDFVVIVNPLPAITNVSTDTSICSGSTTDITLVSTIYLTTYSWTAVSSSPNLSGYSAGSGSEISQTITNSGFTIDTVSYLVTPEAFSCSGPEKEFRVVVFPVPDLANTPLSRSICTGSSTNLALLSNVAGTTFTWSCTGGASVTGWSENTSTPATLIDQTLTLSGSIPDTVIYHITPQSNGCNGPVYDFLVIVYPIPTLTNPLLTQSQCSGLNTSIDLESGVIGTTFTWRAFTNSANLSGYSTNPGPGDTLISQVIANSGYEIDTLIYRIVPEADGCQGDSVDYTVVIFPVPDLSNNPTSINICNNAWTNTTLLSNITGSTFTWTCTQLSGEVTGWSANTIPDTLLDQQLTNASPAIDSVIYHMIPAANGCLGPSMDFTVSVYPVPDVSFSPPSPVICSGDITSIQCLSQVPTTTFTWTTSTNPNVTGNQSGNGDVIADTLLNLTTTIESISYTVTPEAFGCPPGIPDSVIVTINPLPEITNTIRFYAICNQNTVQIPLQSSLTYPTTFTWTASCPSGAVSGYSNGTGSIIQQMLVNNGYNVDTVLYVVTPESNSCSGDTAHFRVVVYPVPDVIITPPVDTLCSGDSSFLALSSHVAGATFTWTATPSSFYLSGFSSGSGNLIRQKLVTSAFTPGSVTYHISPMANGCPGTSNQVTVGIKPSPVVTLPVCFDTITTTGARSILLRGGVPRGGVFEGDHVSGNSFNPAAAGPGRHPVRYSYTNMYDCTRSDTVYISVVFSTSFICGDTIIDGRDGWEYPTVQIGSQCWLAANLNYGAQVLQQIMHSDNCAPEKYCYTNQLTMCNTAGGLYQWDEIMEYSESEGVKGLCLAGWHIPSEDEWNILFANFINHGFAGNALKVTGYSGLNALLEGVRFNNKQWRFGAEEPIINSTFIWSSTRHGPEKAWAHSMIKLLADPEYVPSASYYPSSRINAFSVRCVKD